LAQPVEKCCFANRLFAPKDILFGALTAHIGAKGLFKVRHSKGDPYSRSDWRKERAKSHHAWRVIFCYLGRSLLILWRSFAALQLCQGRI